MKCWQSVQLYPSSRLKTAGVASSKPPETMNMEKLERLMPGWMDLRGEMKRCPETGAVFPDVGLSYWGQIKVSYILKL